ncbi:MAG: hypothetical protein WBA07_09390 [Rivularia sp. (in: cyanobacteria)]
MPQIKIIRAALREIQKLPYPACEKVYEILQMFSQISEQQKSQVISNSSNEISKPPVSIDNQKIVDDLFSELDFHVELDK